MNASENLEINYEPGFPYPIKIDPKVIVDAVGVKAIVEAIGISTILLNFSAEEFYQNLKSDYESGKLTKENLIHIKNNIDSLIEKISRLL